MQTVSSNYVLNTPEEEAEIQRGIKLDPDMFDLSDPRVVLRPFLRRKK